MKNLSLTDIQKESIKIKVEAEIYKRSFYEFFKASSKILYPAVVWDYNWHFEYICDILQTEVERIVNRKQKTKDLIINLPPRSGKSILISQLFPVWIWIKKPSLSIMQVSHSEDLAVKHSHQSKMLIESDWFKERFPVIKLRQDTSAKKNYMTNYGGKRISFGVNGSIIGEGCNIQILDDLNNPSDGKLVTQKINDIYNETLYTRLNNPQIDIRIILQQRIDGNDICGYLLNKQPDNYQHICIPAETYKTLSPANLITNYQDGLYWKKQFPQYLLNDYKVTLGSRAYSGQYLQTPSTSDDAIIKANWIKTVQYIPEHKNETRYYFLDSAYGEKNSDYNALLECYKKDNQLYITNVWKNKKTFPELIAFLKDNLSKDNQSIIYIEGKATGKSVIQQLKVSTNFNCVELKPTDSKLTRLTAIAPTVEGGRVFIYDASWNKEFIDEVTDNYPIHDDVRDVFTYAVDTLLVKKTTSNYDNLVFI